MTKRVYNFNAGPATLPFSVLETIQGELLNFQNLGMSVMEISHRSAAFESIYQGAIQGLRSLLDIPQDYEILFLQGGASLQFSMVPLAFLRQSAAYVRSGAWANKALAEAKKVGQAELVWDGKDTQYTHLPSLAELSVDRYDYLHITSNETIEGVQFQDFPKLKVPLICDASSDILSRPLPVGNFDLIYAGAQKNMGPSGVTVVIVSKALLETQKPAVASMLDYQLLAQKESAYNTPPVFAIYTLGLVTQWALAQGGLSAVQETNRQKAKVIYDVLDAHPDFYKGHARPDARSHMNITFRLPTPELEAEFVKAAAKHDLVGLKGHRSVGGIRASIYNAFPLEGAQALAEFMGSFAQR